KETKLLLDYPIFSKELTVKVNDFLKAKQDFLTARQETITELQKCLNELETFINEKYTLSLEIGNTISNVGGAIADVATFGIPKTVGEAIKAISNLSKIKISKKSDEEFQLFLGGEEDELTKLKDAYSSLVSL